MDGWRSEWSAEILDRCESLPVFPKGSVVSGYNVSTGWYLHDTFVEVRATGPFGELISAKIHIKHGRVVYGWRVRVTESPASPRLLKRECSGSPKAPLPCA